MPAPPKTVNTRQDLHLDYRRRLDALYSLIAQRSSRDFPEDNRAVASEQYWDREERRNFGFHYERNDGPALIVCTTNGAIVRWFSNNIEVRKVRMFGHTPQITGN